MKFSRQLQLLLALSQSINAAVIHSSKVSDLEITSAATTTTTTLTKVTPESSSVNGKTKQCKSKSKDSSSHASVSTLSPSASAVVFPETEPKWYLHDHDIPSGVGNLPQLLTNGKSLLGSLDAPILNHHVGTDKKGIWQLPWGSKTALSADPYHDVPNTGVVRNYTFTIERSFLAPDGVLRPVILVNGQFPGPTIEANWGDWFEITVVNNIKEPEEGTSVHWHGILHKDTPWEDGVPGISQCPIAPGDSFTYRFRADLYGSSWYHAHYSAQYAAGVFGAMIIHGPTDNAEYDLDLGPVLISDYYHDPYFRLVEDTMGSDIKSVIVFSDNNLINGKGVFNCSFARNDYDCDANAGLSKFHFTKGKSHRLRLINAGAEGLQKFSIDGHTMKVIAYDFVPIVPYETEIVTLHVGQRADVIVVADGDSDGAYWMRSTMGKCSNANQPNALAMVYYDNADHDTTPTSDAWEDTTDPCANDDLATAVPYYPIDPPADPELELEIDIAFGKNETGNYVWTMNNSTFRTNFNNPIIPFIQRGGTVDDMPTEWNVYDIGKSKSTRIIINNNTPVSHPMHMHGHNMYVLASTSNPKTPSSSAKHRSSRSDGDGNNDDSSFSATPPLNLKNPTRRDTHILPPKGQIVIQIDGDNAGVWPLHCHVAWHVSGGLYVSLLEDAESLRTMDMGSSRRKMKRVCKRWQNYTNALGRNGETVEVIDSGLRMMEKDK